MANLFLNVHLSKAKLTLFHDGNCFLFASRVSTYWIQQMFLRVVADGSTESLYNALHNHRSLRWDIACDGIWAQTNPNMRYRFHISWWNSQVSLSFSPNLEECVCHFNQYGLHRMWNLIYLCILTIAIHQLLYVLNMAEAVSSTVEQVYSVTSDSLI